MRIKVMKTLVSCFDETCPKNDISPSGARVLGDALNKFSVGRGSDGCGEKRSPFGGY